MRGWIRKWSYRVASRVLGAYRYVRRPTVRGVRCVLLRDDEVLLVRHTYGDRGWSLPGGLPRRREAASEAVLREIHEELGLRLAGAEHLGVLDVVGQDRAHHLVECFAARLPAEASPRADPGEIAEVGWFRAGALPSDLLDGTAEILRRARGR